LACRTQLQLPNGQCTIDKVLVDYSNEYAISKLLVDRSTTATTADLGYTSYSRI